jgi:hypothetical protein
MSAKPIADNCSTHKIATVIVIIIINIIIIIILANADSISYEFPVGPRRLGFARGRKFRANLQIHIVESFSKHSMI